MVANCMRGFRSLHRGAPVFLSWLVLALSPAARADESGHLLPLWRVAGGDNHLYLLGSVHLLRESDHPLPSAVYAAYDDVDTLFMEIDMDAVDPIATQSLVNELAIIHDGRQLRDLMGPEPYSEAESLARRLNIPIAMLADAEPWYAAITVDALMLMRIGFSPEHGIERQLAERAAQDGKAINGLETERQQLEILDGLSPEAQRILLLQSLADGIDIEKTMDDLVAAWRYGDVRQLEEDLLSEIEVYPELFDTLVVRRNSNWVEQIVSLLEQRRNALIVVGTLHLVGEHGVPALLRDRGYSVQQLHQSD